MGYKELIRLQKVLYTIEIIVMTTFAIFIGSFITAVLDEFGIGIAILFFCIAYSMDLLSTVTVKNYVSRETNQLFIMLNKKGINNKISFLVIFTIGLTACLLGFIIMGNPLVAYIIGTMHCSMAVSNYMVRRRDNQNS